MKNTIKNIIFDLGGVLLKDTPKSVLDKLNIDEEEYNLLLNFFEDWENLDLGIESLEDKYIKCNFPNQLSDKYRDILVRYYEKREINLELINLAQKLKKAGYNLYILSDNNKEASNYCQNSNLFKIFDGWVVSCDYKTLKKDGKLFEILLDKYNLNSSECYFIDNAKINIEIAKKYGIIGYIYNEENDIRDTYANMRINGINL